MGVTSLTTRSHSPRRGDIWLVNLDPTIGAEIKKTRPAVIISSDSVGKLPIKLIVPISDWKDYFAGNLWHVRIAPDARNGLSKISVVDTLRSGPWITGGW